MALYLIWSHEHGGWWRPGGWGYVSTISQAGRFEFRGLRRP